MIVLCVVEHQQPIEDWQTKGIDFEVEILDRDFGGVGGGIGDDLREVGDVVRTADGMLQPVVRVVFNES